MRISPPSQCGKENGAASARRLSPRSRLATDRCCRSLEMEAPHSLSHLDHEKLRKLSSMCCWTCFYLLRIRNFRQGSAKSAFKAKPTSGGMSTVNPASCSRLCRSCFVRESISALSWVLDSPPLTLFLACWRTAVRL